MSRLPVSRIALVLAIGVAQAAHAGNGLIADHLARAYGLQRAWHSQAQVDRSRNRVEQATLEGNQLFVLSTAGVLHAMNAETGATDWIATVGNRDYPSLGPAVSAMHVAVVNGSTVYVYKRDTGRQVFVKQLKGGPAAGPSLTDRYVFVPLFSGHIEGFNYKMEKSTPWLYASTGRIYTPTVVSDDNLMWSTNRGYLYVAASDASKVRYRFETTSPMVAAPSARDGLIFAASATGYVYCVQEVSGNQLWRYATGTGVTQSPIVVGERVYVATEPPSLVALDATTGESVWEAPKVSQVVGVSETRVYGIDRLGIVYVIDAATGVLQGKLWTSPDTVAVVNEQTDRLYLISNGGLVQCLHEVGADAPTLHRAPLKPSAEDLAEEGAEPAADESDLAPPADEEAPGLGPFDFPADNGDDEESPFNNLFDDDGDGGAFDF